MISITLSNKEWSDIIDIIDETIHQGWSRYDDQNNGALKLVDNIRWAKEEDKEDD
jgi:hypothetical protein